MALEQEVKDRGQDVADAQNLVTRLAALAAGVPQALDLARQFAATLTTPAQQLTALQAGVHDAASAQQAITAAQQIQSRCQFALQIVHPAEQTWSSVSALAQQRAGWLQARWQQTHREPPPATADGSRSAADGQRPNLLLQLSAGAKSFVPKFQEERKQAAQSQPYKTAGEGKHFRLRRSRRG